MGRGVVLEKIWRTYVELFERALSKTRLSLKRCQEKGAHMETELVHTNRALNELHEKQPQQVEMLSKTLAGKFSQRQTELRTQLTFLQKENNVLQQHLDEQTTTLQAWFPKFGKYKDSDHKVSLATLGPILPTTTAPEARIAADFKRVLTALPEECRQKVIVFVSSLLGLHSHKYPDTLDGLAERRLNNQLRIQHLEAQ